MDESHNYNQQDRLPPAYNNCPPPESQQGNPWPQSDPSSSLTPQPYPALNFNRPPPPQHISDIGFSSNDHPVIASGTEINDCAKKLESCRLSETNDTNLIPHIEEKFQIGYRSGDQGPLPEMHLKSNMFHPQQPSRNWLLSEYLKLRGLVLSTSSTIISDEDFEKLVAEDYGPPPRKPMGDNCHGESCDGVRSTNGFDQEDVEPQHANVQKVNSFKN